MRVHSSHIKPFSSNLGNSVVVLANKSPSLVFSASCRFKPTASELAAKGETTTKKYAKTICYSSSGQDVKVTEASIPNEDNIRKLYAELSEILEEYRRAPPSFKQEISTEIGGVYERLKAAKGLDKWGIALQEFPSRRNVGLGELRMVGVKSPESLSSVSVRNDAAFLFSVVASTSVLAVLAGQLPGDWGFFTSYFVGGISFVVLAIGSVNPGLLQVAIDSFGQIFPDYRNRVIGHEAAHILMAYLLRVPLAGYSLMVGKEHTDLAEAALQRRLIERQLEPEEVDRLSVIAMAGATSEAMAFDEVMGQTADMFDLQRIMNRSSVKLSAQQQQNQTRWAAYQAAILLRRYSAEYEAVKEVMKGGATVKEIIEAIERA